MMSSTGFPGIHAKAEPSRQEVLSGGALVAQPAAEGEKTPDLAEEQGKRRQRLSGASVDLPRLGCLSGLLPDEGEGPDYICTLSSHCWEGAVCSGRRPALFDRG